MPVDTQYQDLNYGRETSGEVKRYELDHYKNPKKSLSEQRSGLAGKSTKVFSSLLGAFAHS